MKNLLLLSLLLSTKIVSAQVEINPVSGADLNLKSQTKGMLLPRISKPANVNSPVEGLLIYNKESKTPAFHNGTSWNMVATTPAATIAQPDTLTYLLIGTQNGFPNSHVPHNLKSFNITEIAATGAGGTMVPGVVTFSFSKMSDVNSIGFLLNSTRVTNMNSLAMEVKVFHRGVSTPYFSYKFSRFVIISYQSDVTPAGVVEQYTVKAQKIEARDWDNNAEMEVDFQNGSSARY